LVKPIDLNVTMVRNIVVLGGNSHPALVDSLCHTLGLPSCNRILNKFSSGESRCEIQDSVRGKDVYIIQTGFGGNGSKLNDHFMDLCIMISACKTGSARRVTAVLPLFPYSRQPDLPYKKAGAPLFKAASENGKKDYTFDSVPATPAPGVPQSAGLVNGADITNRMFKTSLTNGAGSLSSARQPNGESYFGGNGTATIAQSMTTPVVPSYTTHDYENLSHIGAFQPKTGYKQWVAQAGTLVANLLTCAGADHGMSLPGTAQHFGRVAL
jgi:ribose-phosphate pyrophosphokinase